MDKLKKACETKKRTLESVIAEADGELGKQEPSLEMLMSLRPKLLRCKDRFLIASDCLIEQLIKADREDEEIEDVDIVQANLFGRSEGVLQKMEQLLAKPTVDRESIVSGGNEGKSNLHRLPKLELPKFGGEAREWLQFWSAFQSVHDDDSISACVKFQYLQNCMIKGSVSEEIVSSFPNSAANYPLVISTLKERFGREDMLVEVYVRDLIAIILENAHGRNTTSFSTVYVRLSSQLRALGSLGVTTDKCAAILYPMVESALPEDLFVAWERTRHHHKPDEDGKHNSSEALLEKLMEFLKHEVEGSERMRLARQPFSSSYPSQFNRDKPPKPKTSVATAASLVVADVSKGSQKSDGIEERSKNINASVDMSNQIRCQDVLLQTIMVKINGENKSKVVRAMLDSGSQNSYVLEQTASEVGLTMLGKKEVVHLLFGGVKSRPQQNKRYRIYISDVDSKYNCNFEVQDCSTICSAMPSAQPTEWMTELRSKGIDLDVYRSNTEIELLLGADVYAKLLTGKKIELESGPVALETKLGWTVSGKVLGNVQTTKSQSVLSCLVRDATIQDLWRLDVIGIMEPMKEKSKEELSVAALEHFNQTVKQNEDGRYSVNLPWIGGHPPLPNYKLISEKKLESTTARLEKLGVLSTYHDVFKSWEDEGIIERVDSESGHVLSHHGVIKPESQSTPVRPVFNASFRTKGNPSLNDCLEVGPNMLENIPDIITRFRLGPVAVTSDIRQAFLQIEVAEEDRNYLQFWWYKNQKLEEKQMYRHCRVVFGVSSSPFPLAAVIDHHLSTYEDEYKKTIDILRRSMYVDNCVASVGSKEDALKFKEESVEIFGTAKMDLREWEIGPSSEEKPVPVLGLFWNLRTDELTCDLRSFAKKMEPGKVTRRKILSAAHSLFDPIGFTCPFTIIPKMLLQESYGVKAGWDTDLSEDISRRFNAWLSQLTEVDKLKIPRCVVQSQDRRTWTLHVFMDSSNAAFAACAYLRSGFPGSVQVQLLMARSRVAPMKNTTIPRLELVACEIGSRLAVHIKSMMEFEDIPITLWTDSTTALAWIKRDMNWSVFVAGRVKKIRQNSSVIDWRHVPGKENPADIPSRGASISQLITTRWWEGPVWLKKEEQFWTQSVEKESIEEVNSELRKAVVTHCNIEKGDMLAKITQFSNYHKILRMVAHWRRFLDWLQRKRSNKITKGPITMEEMTLAEERVIRLVQQCSFEGVKDKKFKNLRVYEDESGLLRVKCRFVPVEKVDAHSYPMVMPSNGVTGQLIWSYHRLMCHAGVQSLHANLRERYWILNSRRTIRNEIRPCARCRRFRAQPCYVEEGPLPRDRVRVGPAFDVTGVDMTGPLHLKGNKKYWIAIFTCATYRAIHLELCTSLTTETFIGAMRRFVARRGRPSTIYSDNGLNFVGCKNLFSSLDWNKIVEYGAINRISWKFNPPTACWWGGFWERMIGIVKQLLRSVLGSARVTNEELQTLLCDVEAVVNNRPLTYVSEDDEELAPLTPNKLINNCGSSILPEADEVERDSMVSRYRNMQACREELRARFTKEYLAMLVHHGKARKSRRIERQRDPSTFSGDGNINSGQWLKEYERVSEYNRWDDTMKLANVVFTLTELLKGDLIITKNHSTRGEALKTHSAVNPRMEEGEIVAHIIKGISEDTYQVLVAKDIQTVDEILKFCRHLTTVKQRRIGRTKFARLSNVMPNSCADDSDDLAGLIRCIVREEIQKVLSPPEVVNPLREVNALEQTVREVVSRFLQLTRAQINVVQQQPRTPYNIDRPTQPRKTEHWRTYDDKPICFHCGRPGHVVRYCRERRQVFAEARSRNGGEGKNVGFSSRPPRYDAGDDYVTPQTSTFIQKAGLSLNHKKCLFGSRRIKISGHLVDANGIHPDPEKVEAVSKFPRPKNISELRSFLGLYSYYQRFIENFADKARSLHDLLKTEKQLYWDAAQEKAFGVLKTALISEPVLEHFDESADTHLHTDASGHGIGAVFLQIQGGKERPIAYASRSLTKAEHNYSTTEKECLAVVWSISKFRPYLFGRPFTVVTDHHSLCWLVGQKDPSGRLARWALKLQEFDVTVIYRSGRKHKDADCLSRSPLENDQSSAVMSLTKVDIEQTKDPDLAKIIDNLNSGYIRKEFSIIDGILYKKNYSTTGRPWLMMIPKHLRSEVMADLHDAPTAGHLGFARTYDKVKKRFYWPGLYRTVRQYVSHCRECQRRKKLPRRLAGQLVSIPPVEKPFYKVGVDLLGRFPVSKDGNRWIIVCTDYMTRDRERNFISQVIKEINALCGIVHRFTTAYHPQTNGLTEATGYTPFFLVHAREAKTYIDAVLPYLPDEISDDYVGELVTRAEEAR
ncbi:hypothetical protein LAZ67_12001873 [Cordylochernes scorpioides]|uniref:RNA-directed DNA polymerase n=1 Tax=Cordylochernes scorpioides TaxID=51811 RepID=A0ABY6L1E3_9ARAC|nr:hypothetical protein LAZ67_12001873 [Cordylochernes scorpioides]